MIATCPGPTLLQLKELRRGMRRCGDASRRAPDVLLTEVTGTVELDLVVLDR